MPEAYLRSVYEESVIPDLIEEIDRLLIKYKNRIQPGEYSLSEKDAVLITYPDQLRSEVNTPLSNLHIFMDKYLSGVVNTIHLLPFYPYSSDDGFSVIDYYEVESEHGSWQDVEMLAGNYRLMFDAVINHISESSDWVKRFIAGDPDYENYFIAKIPDADYSKVVRPRVSPLFHQYESGRELWSTFSKDQVDLNYSNPSVFLHILDVLLYYLSKGARLIRLDAVGFLWKEPGTTSLHLPQTHSIIKAYREILEKVTNDVTIITETNVPHKENISYFGSGDEATMVYNFTLPPLLAYSVLSGNTRVFRDWLSGVEAPGEDICFFNFLASHDGVGVRPVEGILKEHDVSVLINSCLNNGGKVSYKSNPDGSEVPYEINCNYLSLLCGTEGDLGKGIKRFLLAHAVMLAMPGVPGLYFHSLAGSLNDIDGMMNTGHNRSINREKSDLQSLEKELNDAGERRHQIFHRLKMMLSVRTAEKAFHPFGSLEILDSPDGTLLFEKRWQKHSIYMAGNFTEEEQRIKMKEGDFLDAMSGETVSTELVLEGYGYRWIKPLLK